VRILTKALLSLLTGAIPVFIAACYGPPAECTDAEGTVKDPGGNPIANILVRCMLGGAEQNSTTTAAGDGAFALTYCSDGECDALRFEDVDGAENGGAFASKEIPFVPDGGLDVTLEPAE
jgi:hypothetical protein